VTGRPPIACTLSPEALRARREDLLPGLASRAALVTFVDGGVQLRIPSSPDAVAAIGRVVDAERACCRFLSFTIAAAPDQGPIVVTVTAPPEAQDLLTDLVNRSG
jgi:hypothetical protein